MHLPVALELFSSEQPSWANLTKKYFIFGSESFRIKAVSIHLTIKTVLLKPLGDITYKKIAYYLFP